MAHPSTLTVIPKLADLLNDPAAVSDLPLEAVPGLRAELAKLDSLLLMRLSFPQSNGQPCSQEGDRLLTAKEAGGKLCRSEDGMYRHANEFPFTVRDGRQVRFSQKGIEKYIRQRVGR